MNTINPTTQTPIPASESPKPATWWERAIALADRYGVTADNVVSVTTHPHAPAVRYRVRSRSRLLRIHTVTLLEPVRTGAEPLISCDCEAAAACWHIGLVLTLASQPDPATRPAIPVASPAATLVARPARDVVRDTARDRETALLHRSNRPFSLYK